MSSIPHRTQMGEIYPRHSPFMQVPLTPNCPGQAVVSWMGQDGRLRPRDLATADQGKALDGYLAHPHISECVAPHLSITTASNVIRADSRHSAAAPRRSGASVCSADLACITPALLAFRFREAARQRPRNRGSLGLAVHVDISRAAARIYEVSRAGRPMRRANRLSSLIARA